MPERSKKASVRGAIVLLLVILNAVIIKVAFIENSKWYLVLIISVPVLLIAIKYSKRKRQTNITGNRTKSEKVTCNDYQYLN
jgi:4-hydroxybenzoate polyprenyltransferase